MTHTVNNKHICQGKKKKEALFNTTLPQNKRDDAAGEEKSVIHRGAYIVIKSHVKKKKMQTHATHSHSGSVATLPVRTASYRKKNTLHKTPQTSHPSTKQHTLIFKTKESIFATEEARLFKTVQACSCSSLHTAESRTTICLWAQG